MVHIHRTLAAILNISNWETAIQNWVAKHGINCYAPPANDGTLPQDGQLLRFLLQQPDQLVR
jgi:hypothetical protein